MATETNKETASKEAPPAVVTGNSGKVLPPQKSSLKRPSVKKWLWLLIGVVIVVAAWGLLSNYSGTAGGAVFTINGKKYDQADVKQLAAYQTNVQHVPYKIAAKKVYDALRYQTAAKSVHITVTPAEAKQTRTNVSQPTYNKYKTWFDIVDYNSAVAHKLPAATKDGKQGYVYVLWFGDAVQPSYGTPSPKYKNQQAYQSDQRYAQQQANYYHDQLQNKKMSPEQVLTAITKNSRLALNGQPASNPSLRFGLKPYTTWQDQIANKTIVNYINASSGQLSPVETGQTATTLGPNPSQYTNAYYYIVLLQKTNVANITQQFHDAQAHLKAKYYGV